MAMPKDFTMGGDGVAAPASSKIYTLSFTPESNQTKSSDEPKMISSQEMIAVIVVMLQKILENLQMLTKKDSEDVTNKANNGFMMAQQSDNELQKMKDDLKKLIDEENNRPWWQKALSFLNETKIFGVSLSTIIITAVSVAVAACTMGAAAGIVALAIGVLSAFGAFDANSNGPLSGFARALDTAAEKMSSMSKTIFGVRIPTEYCKFILKMAVILAVAAAGGAASTIGVEAGATSSYVMKTTAVLIAMQLMATTGATYDLCMGLANTVDSNGNEETKKKWAMLAAMIVNIVAMIAAMKIPGSADAANLSKFATYAERAQNVQRFLTFFISITTVANQFVQADILDSQKDYVKTYAERQKNMTILNGMGELNSNAAHCSQEEMKSNLDEYTKIFSELANYTAESAMLAKVLGR